MKNYLVLYMAPIEELDMLIKNTTPEEMKKMNDDWTEWVKKHKKELVVTGSPLGKNKRVTQDGIKDVRNELTGYSVVQAESHEEAAKIFLDNPQLEMPGAYIEVVEYVDMPEME